MAKILIAPGRYVQGPGVLKEAGEQLKGFGKKLFICGDAFTINLTQDTLNQSVQAAGLEPSYEQFNGECSFNEIERLIGKAQDLRADVIVAVGGGKVIDAGKAVAMKMGLPVAVIPTIAATDAPCSALSVIYTEEGVVEHYLITPANPNLVLVDTAIIAKAPVRFLVAGMGDALATWFEADSASRTNSKNMPGGLTTVTALSLARLSYDTLLEYGEMAKEAVQAGAVTEAVDRIVEANTLLSGLGFESGGLAAAHAIHDGLTVLEETHHYYHGEKVSFGVLTHIVLEGRRPDQIEEVLDFCSRVGLPVTLAEIGVTDPTPEKIRAVAEKACAKGSSIYNMPVPISVQAVEDAILGADAIGRAFKKKFGV
ncbi:glycerol dehydrogenase [Heliorestis convoluta]|uniref:Glycerol dehydrogenase n=1 Tax=Heliorestis convoluta TaxID=356322 RepID=A0A5Q2N676_9FIRM|nr:glycerol dehydrogenase [Heliorestis convoluta]QGG49443.1 glycerol dehydrogenase [Heliorestis convoluta]